LQVLVAVRVFMGQRVNLQEKYDYPANEILKLASAFFAQAKLDRRLKF